MWEKHFYLSLSGKFGIISDPLRPHTNCSFVTVDCHILPFWNILHLASFIPPDSRSAAHFPPQEVDDFPPYFTFSHTRLCKYMFSVIRQVWGQYWAKVLHIPDSLTVARGALLFHKESPISIFFASSSDLSGRQRQTFRVYQQMFP